MLIGTIILLVGTLIAGGGMSNIMAELVRSIEILFLHLVQSKN